MFDSRKQNPNCTFGEEIVSYIYDEMQSSKKADFETHLDNCTPCADEIAAFSNVSFSIQEWKNEEFAVLDTPKIEIPYATPEVPVTPVTIMSEDVGKSSWLDKFREQLNFSPVFFKTATAFGTIALAIGLIWFLIGSDSNKDNSLADSKNELQQQKNEVVAMANTKEIDENDKPEIDKIDQQEILVEPENVQPRKVVAKETPKTKQVISPKRRITTKVKNLPKSRINNNSKPAPKQDDLDSKPKGQQINEIKELPRLTDFALEESDERDLRLTDFFDDDESGDE